MASSTGEKFNRLIAAKEQIRKAINKKGVRVAEDLPIEQYADKIKAIPFYDSYEQTGFAKFLSGYYSTMSNSGYQFYNNKTLQSLSDEEVGYLDQLGFTECRNVSHAFESCTNLTAVAPMNLTAAIDCQYMLSGCTNLRELNITVASDALTAASYMFNNCQNLTGAIISVATANTSCSVQSMFGGGTNVAGIQASLSLPSFSYLFSANSMITSLDFLNGWSLLSNSGAPDWSYMFSGCTFLNDLTFPEKLNYTPPKSLAFMFQRSACIKSATLQDFFDKLDLSAVATMQRMFYNTKNGFDGLNLSIRLPADGQSCSIYGMFGKSSESYMPDSKNDIIEYFGFNGSGSAESLFDEGAYDSPSYHFTTHVGSLYLPYVTSLYCAFYYNTKLESIDEITTGTALTNTYQMFYNCSSLTSVPAFETSNVTNMDSMFYGCKALVCAPQLNTQKVTSTYQMFYNCTSLTSIPALNTTKCGDFRYMFYNCTSLTSIPALDLSLVNNNYSYTSPSNRLYYMFYGCSKLEEIHCMNIKTSLDISYSTNFAREALVEIIGNLIDVGSSRTLHMGSTNLSKLTEEDIAVATAKGWTLN